MTDATPARSTPTIPGPAVIDPVLADLRGVRGWLTDAQVLRLWTRAAALRPGARIVEIGSFQGRSTIVMARASVPGVEIVAIDPHGGTDRGPGEYVGYEREGEADHDAFHDNLARAGVADRVRHIRRLSSDALGELEGPIDLLFIDGAHRYAPARDDIRRWGSRVPAGGRMLVHDSFSAVGVTLAQVTELFGDGHWRYVGRSGTLTEYCREPRLGLRQRVQNAASQARQLPYFAYNLALKVMILAGLRRYTRYLRHPSGDWPH